MRFSPALAPLLILAATGCVSGSQIRADAEVIKNDAARARESGAMRCAPRDLAVAEANLDFSLADLAQGSSFTARGEMHEAEVAIKRALVLSKDCGRKQILVREKEKEKEPEHVVQKPPPLVVKIEELDTDHDGIPDKDDKCPDQPEDKDGFQDDDGCPDPDNDGDGIVDAKDKCPNEAGAIENFGCPIKDSDGDGLLDNIDKCPNEKGPPENAGCPDQDKDGDGIIDRLDKCPEQKGTPERQGCPVLDRDGDGIPDDVDKCPDQPEDKDGFQDDDGCPDPDNDGDKTPDKMDKCPDQAGPPENFGCPDTDRDGDGIPDRLDKCPDEPEDKDGFEDKDGCPDLDNDQDGIPDAQDKCPNKAGPAENEGCPDVDRDGDGIPDRLDKCPDEFGVKEEQGCQKKYKMVVVKKDRIEIKQQIKFSTNSAKIVGAQSFEIIAEVAAALRDNPQIKKVRIEGHTDSVGDDAANLKLSQNRANSVMSALIKEGIDPSRLEAVGYGETKPIASNATKAGRAENRRTEFNIVEQ